MRLTPPIRMTLEKALAYIEDDELVEITPKSSACASGTSMPTTASAPRRARSRWPAEDAQPLLAMTKN